MAEKKNTVVRGCLVPSLKNKPLDGRQDVATLDDIAKIENPYVNFIFPVAETGKWYKVTSLKTKILGELEIPDGEIDGYELFGEGLTEEEKKEFLTKTLAEQTYLKKDDAKELYQPRGNYQPAGDYATNKALDDLRNEVNKKECAVEVAISESEPTLDDVKLWVDTSVVTDDSGGSGDTGNGDNTGSGDNGGGSDTKQYELLSISVVNDANEPFTAIVEVDGEVVEISNSSNYSKEIAYGSEYNIEPKEINMYSTSDNFIFTAGQPVRNVTINYDKTKITAVKIDQTSKDASTAVTRITDNGGIESIRGNSHRYVGTYMDGVMYLKQLNDNDGSIYADDTDASQDIKTNNVFMKLPKFYYKCSQSDDDASYIYLNFAYGARPDDTYKEWNGKELIGVYPTSRANSYSNAGVSVVSGTQTIPTIDDHLRFLHWKHLCVMHWLSIAYYKTTRYNELFGYVTDGNNYYTTGVTNAYGMNDTEAEYTGASIATNMWGLEGWTCVDAGSGGTYIAGVSGSVDGFVVTEDDGTERSFSFSEPITATASGCISKFYPGENLDVFFDPNEKVLSADLLYLDTVSLWVSGKDFYHNYSSRSNNIRGVGVSNIKALATFRIAYSGEWVEQ